MKIPKISVIFQINSFNHFFLRSVESILQQSLSDFELIITTPLKCNSLSEKANILLRDSRVRLIQSQEYNRFQTGLKNARADYVALMSGDDIADQNRLQIQFDFARHNQFGCVGSQGYLIDNNDRVLRDIDIPTDIKHIKVQLFKNIPLINSSLFFKKTVFRDYNLKFEESFYACVVKCIAYSNFINLSDRLIYERLLPLKNETSSDDNIRALRTTRLSLLNCLEVTASNREMYVFNHLMEDSLLNQEELQIVVKFLNKIIRKNVLKNFYCKEILFDFFHDILNRSVHQSARNFWSLDSDVIEFIKSKIEARSRILEFGSGCGTDKLLENFKVTSIEHDYRYILKRGISHRIFHAPLTNGWYDPFIAKKAIHNSKYALIVVDGPPGCSRAGILNNLDCFGTLSCPVIFDDMNRELDKSTMQIFCKEMGYTYSIFKGVNKEFAYCTKFKEDLKI